MASTIGIKIANGEFYPIMEENSQVKRRLILTTVHDNQPTVQIDLYRSSSGIMTDAQYIGSLVVDNIKPRPKRVPDIEMTMSSDSDGNIVADAIDLAGPDSEHYVLTVSLKCLDDTTSEKDIPDFELDSSEEPPAGLYQHAKQIHDKEKRSPKIGVIVLIGLLIILCLAAIWLFLFGGLDKIRGTGSATVTESTWETPEPVRQEPAAQSEPAQTTVTVQPRVEPTPIIQAPAAPQPPRTQTRTSGRRPPVASYNVPATIPREGVDYRIRWGDTLWDISEAFYRDPWLYPRIARNNNIRNPDLIISGRTIRIPPKN
jgi:hypothetical protein